MKKAKLIVSLALVCAMMCCMMLTSFAASRITYQCNGRNAGTSRTSSHSYGNGLNCDVMLMKSYCTQYVNNVARGTAYHTHNHLTYHTGCPAGQTYPCTHSSTHS